MTNANTAPTIVLKTVMNDVCADIKKDRKIDIDLDGKKVRDFLRRNADALGIPHVHNSSWIFTMKQRDAVYDRLRAMNDPKYVETLARRAKAATRKPRKAKETKVETPETTDA